MTKTNHTDTNLDDILSRTRPVTAEDDPHLLALVAPMSAAARAQAGQEPRRPSSVRRPRAPLIAVAVGGALLLGGGALVEGLQPDYDAHATIALALPGDPFVENGASAPTECVAEVRVDVTGGDEARDQVERAVEGSDWSGLQSRLGDVVRSGRGETGLAESVVTTLDAGVRATLDPQLVGSARYAGVSLTCGGAE